MAENDGQRILDALRAQPQQNSNVNTLPALPEPRAGVEQYAREGVPLDVTSGAPFLTRAGLSFANTEEDHLNYLQSAFKGSEVEAIPDNQFIVRNVLDPRTGQTKDLLVDEQEVTLKDLADLTRAGVQTGAEIATMNIPVLSKLIGGLGRAGRVGAQSIVAGVSGELTSSATGRALQASSDSMGDLVKHMAQNTVSGAVLGGALEAVAGARSIGKGELTSELAPGPTERTGIQAIEKLNKDTGSDIRPSLGQMAGSPDIINLEAYLERLPIFGKRLQAQRLKQEGQIRDFQESLINPDGAKPLQPLSNVGADLADVVRNAVKAPAQAQQAITTSLATRAADQLETAIVKMSPVVRPLTAEFTSDIVKASARGQMKDFKGITDQLFTEAGNPDIPTAPLKPLLEEIRSGLPKKTVVEPGELIDLAGKPLATTEGKVIVRELIPNELLKFINGLESLDPAMPLDQLRRVRNTVDDAISVGRGLEGVNTYELKQLQHALTETIKQGAESLGEAGKPILRANAFYKENIERFETPLVARLLKEAPSDPGFIGSHALLDSIRANPDEFNALQSFLKSSVTESGKAIGATSEPTFNLLRRSLMEDIFDRARVQPGSSASALNADTIVSELHGFKSDVRAALLGASESTINKNLDLLAQLKTGFKDIPADKLDAFIRFPSNSIDDLSKLAIASRETARLERNEVVKRLLKGEEGETRADSVVDWLMDAKNHSDAAEVMAMARGQSPELAEQIERNAVARVFQEVAQKSKPADAAHIADGTYLVNPSKLIDAFKSNRDRLRLILGNRNFNVMENFAQAQSVLGKKAAGTLPGASQGTSLLTKTFKTLANLPQTAKFTIYSIALTNPQLQRAVIEGSLNPATDVSEFTKLLIASPPILKALAEQYGQTGTEMILQLVQDGAKAYQAQIEASQQHQLTRQQKKPAEPQIKAPEATPEAGIGQRLLDALQK